MYWYYSKFDYIPLMRYDIGEINFSSCIEYRIWKLVYQVWKLEYRVWELDYRVWKIKYRVFRVEYRVSDSIFEFSVISDSILEFSESILEFSDSIIIETSVWNPGTLRDNQRTRLSQILINFMWKKSVSNKTLVVWPSGDFRATAFN